MITKAMLLLILARHGMTASDLRAPRCQAAIEAFAEARYPLSSTTTGAYNAALVRRHVEATVFRCKTSRFGSTP